MDVFVARQPIFNRKNQVVAYELLFRYGHDNRYQAGDGDQATLDVINNSFLVIGIETLTEGKKAFINFTANLLQQDIASILPKKYVTVEVLENVEPTAEVIAACRSLKGAGYELALDDFVFHKRLSPLINLADIIKVDFLNTSPDDRRQIFKNTPPQVKLLAEKVETKVMYETAISEGYHYFQGYFFSKPVIVSGKDIPSHKLATLQLLEALSQPEVDYAVIEDIIKRDVSLPYKLLKFVNSAAFGFKERIQSIKHSLALLGKQEIDKWISLVALRGLGQDKPGELVVVSTIRARFCEQLILPLGFKERSADAFLLGLFSLIDAFLDRPLTDILAELALAQDVKAALLGNSGMLRDVLNLVIAYERGQWGLVSRYCAKLKIDEADVSEMYVESLRWAREYIGI